MVVFIEEHGTLGGAVVDHWCDDLEDTRKALEENYAGEHRSLADYSQELTEDTEEVPQHLEFYIHYENMGWDMGLSGDIYTIETGYENVHVFFSH